MFSPTAFPSYFKDPVKKFVSPNTGLSIYGLVTGTQHPRSRAELSNIEQRARLNYSSGSQVAIRTSLPARKLHQSMPMGRYTGVRGRRHEYVRQYRKAQTTKRVLNRKRGYTNRRTGGFSGIESKFFDTNVAGLAFSTSWISMPPSVPTNVDCISSPGVGTSESQHIGRTFNMQSIFVRGQVALPATEDQGAPVADIVWRIIIVMDTQTNGAEVTAATVVDAGTNGTQAFRNLQHSTRYKILYDTGRRLLKPSGQTNAGVVDKYTNAGAVAFFNFNKVFKVPIKVRTTADDAKVGSIADYSIAVIGIASDTNLDLSFTTRLRYSEI